MFFWRIFCPKTAVADFCLQISSLYVTHSRIITAPLNVETAEIFDVVSTPLGKGGGREGGREGTQELQRLPVWDDRRTKEEVVSWRMIRNIFKSGCCGDE